MEFLKEELYMMQPGGFVDPKVLKNVQAPAIHPWTGPKHLRVGIYALMS